MHSKAESHFCSATANRTVAIWLVIAGGQIAACSPVSRKLFFVLAATLCIASLSAQQVVTASGAGSDPALTAPATKLPANAASPSVTLSGTIAPYLLRPGDTVSVNYRFTPEFDDTATIAPDGHLALKNIGQLQAAGASVLELQARILDASRAQLINPEVTISLKDFEHPQIVVGGDVRVPARFDLRRPTTALQAILLAGGPNQDSAMGHVYVFRRVNGDTAQTIVLNLRHLRTEDRAAHDLLLQPDDMVLVRQDALSTVERYVKLVNIGVYFNPLGNNGLF